MAQCRPPTHLNLPRGPTPITTLLLCSGLVQTKRKPRSRFVHWSKSSLPAALRGGCCWLSQEASLVASLCKAAVKRCVWWCLRFFGSSITTVSATILCSFLKAWGLDEGWRSRRLPSAWQSPGPDLCRAGRGGAARNACRQKSCSPGWEEKGSSMATPSRPAECLVPKARAEPGGCSPWMPKGSGFPCPPLPSPPPLLLASLAAAHSITARGLREFLVSSFPAVPFPIRLLQSSFQAVWQAAGAHQAAPSLGTLLCSSHFISLALIQPR